MNGSLTCTALGCGSLTVFADLQKVGTHGFACLVGVMLLDRFQNSFVMNLPAIGSAGNPKDAQTLFAQQSDDRIQQRENQGIRSPFRKRQMEIEIRFDISVWILAGSVHY